MLRTKPKLTYNGLTVVLSNPSRFDKINLLSATGGKLFNDCLRPEFNVGQCDIRLKDDTTPLLSGTRCIIACGEAAAKQLLPQYRDNTIGEIRGLASYNDDGLPVLSTFFPQDAADIKNYEAENNLLYESADDDEEDRGDYGSEKRRHGRTNRKNYSFWLLKDLAKCKYLLRNSSRIPARPFQPNYVIYPEELAIRQLLERTKNEYFYFDMETDRELQMLCFSFSFSGDPSIYVVPCVDHNYSWGYSNLHLIFKSLQIAIRDNTIVSHNGSGFDFFVLAKNYRIGIKKAYDTMLAQHRCFPEVEKSLGHTISLWCWYEPFHKDEGGSYSNHEQCRQMWSYCGKDVFTMRLCHTAIEEYAKKQPGLKESIDQANASIRPYLITELMGMRYSQSVMDDTMKTNDRLMTQYLRFIKLLVGYQMLPSSNKQTVEYFHNQLHYPVIGYGKPSKKDGSKKPSLGKKNIFKLRLRFDNPVLDLCISYREAMKESGSLKFTPWKNTTV